MSDGLLRISEVTELRISDLEDNTLRVRHSKTDQEGQGEHLYLCEDTRQRGHPPDSQKLAKTVGAYGRLPLSAYDRVG